MRVLMVLHAPPCSPALGPARRHLHLFEEIARRHTVSIITLGSHQERVQFEREHGGLYEHAVFVERRPRVAELLVALWYFATWRCVFRRLFYRPVQRAIDRAVARGRFDAVYFSTVLLGYYRIPAGIRIVGDAHNVEHEVLSRAAAIARGPIWKTYYRMQARATRRDEVRLARRFSEVWATSHRDAEQFARARGDSKVAVVPNGIRCRREGGDTDEAAAAQTANDASEDDRRVPPTPTLLFVGLMSYFPNQDAVDYFLDDVFPQVLARMPAARFVVVGADPPRRLRARAAHNVEVVGRVASVEPYLARASAFVVPLRSGGGTRVKVLEAMVHRVPVVSTTIGCEGISVRDRQSVLLADTPHAFADAVAAVCRQPALAHRLTAAAYDVIGREYDWRRIGDSVHMLLDHRAFA